MKEITLSQGKFALVDDEDYERVNQYKWSAFKNRKTFYAMRINIGDGKRTTVRMHRFILKTPKGMHVDHKNENGLDNRRINIRNCMQAENQANRTKLKNNTSGYKGVHYHKRDNKWFAQIGVNNKQIFLGNFKTAKEAATAYNEGAKKYFGEFAQVNSL